MGSFRWECHPEIVAALTDALRDDPKDKVRAQAAEALGTLVPNLPTSHVALTAARQADPSAGVRKESGKALAAKGLRCVTDCPICGPLPRGSAIIGPEIRLPELILRPEPKHPWRPAETGDPSGLPTALPDPLPRR